MSHIRRNDGTQFVMQSYRELLNFKQISVLKREIRALAKKQGENICVFKRDNGKFEIVFSREPGFLLGETVWSYFSKPRNLIYCEALPEKENALLVIVKEGNVYLDNKLSYAELVEELAALSTSNEKYDVYVHGDVPISEAAEKNKVDVFVLDKKLINSFKILPAPIFSALSLNSSLQLLPLELALTSPYFKNKFVRPILSLVIVLVIVFSLGYLIFSPSSSTEKNKIQQQPKNPYELFNKDLATPAPAQQLAEMNKIIGNLMALPGWDLVNLEYRDGTYTAEIKPLLGATFDSLQQWAKICGVNVSGTGGEGGATLTISSKLINRPVPANIYNLDKVVTILISKINLVIAKEDVKVGQMNNYQKTKSLDLEIVFKDFSPLTFDLIGKLLAGFPLHITSVTASVAKNLFSGSIKLTIWGS